MNNLRTSFQRLMVLCVVALLTAAHSFVYPIPGEARANMRGSQIERTAHERAEAPREGQASRSLADHCHLELARLPGNPVTLSMASPVARSFKPDSLFRGLSADVLPRPPRPVA